MNIHENEYITYSTSLIMINNVQWFFLNFTVTISHHSYNSWSSNYFFVKFKKISKSSGNKVYWINFFLFFTWKLRINDCFKETIILLAFSIIREGVSIQLRNFNNENFSQTIMIIKTTNIYLNNKIFLNTIKKWN